jgi:hypothetical protein
MSAADSLQADRLSDHAIAKCRAQIFRMDYTHRNLSSTRARCTIRLPAKIPSSRGASFSIRREMVEILSAKLHADINQFLSVVEAHIGDDRNEAPCAFFVRAADVTLASVGR